MGTRMLRLRRGRSRRLEVGVTIAWFIVAMAYGSGVAHADDEYSVGYENSAGTRYTAGAETKTEYAMSIPGTTCAANYTRPVVYEPLWLEFGTSDWLEVGTGYSCNNVRYRYTYECLNGSCAYGQTYSLVNGGVDVRFRIIWNGSAYAMQVGSSTLATSYHGGKKAVRVDTGIENHAGEISIRRQDFKSLAYSLDFSSTGLNWSGRDAQLIQTNMCGGWASDVQWFGGRLGTC